MTISLVYDPRYHTFQSWASLMCEAYAGQQLQIPSDNEDEWKSWAAPKPQNPSLSCNIFY